MLQIVQESTDVASHKGLAQQSTQHLPFIAGFILHGGESFHSKTKWEDAYNLPKGAKTGCIE